MFGTAHAAKETYRGSNAPCPSVTGCRVGDMRLCTSAVVSRNSRECMSVARITLNSKIAVQERHSQHIVVVAAFEPKKPVPDKRGMDIPSL